MGYQGMNTGIKLVSVDPGEIKIMVQNIEVPVKSLQVSKKTVLTPELNTGSHLATGLTVGGMTYEGSFEVGTFLVEGAGEKAAAEWNQMLRKYLEFPEDEGIPQYFSIRITDRRTSETVEEYQFCRLSGDSWNIGEPGQTSRKSYPFMALRRVLGIYMEQSTGVEGAIYPTQDV